MDERYPIYWTFDFNIGVGKPFSVCFFQCIKGIFHFFDEIIIEGQQTEEICHEALNRGLLDYRTQYVITGDQTGKRRDTRSKRDDFRIIEDFLKQNKNKYNQHVSHKVKLPTKNPPIRKRHNLVNGKFYNMKKEVNLFVYKNCATLDKGFRLTHLVKGGQYLEDDSDFFQHVTTAAGYGINICEATNKPNKSGMM